MRRVPVSVTTDAAGAATVYSSALSGLLHAVYAENGDLAATADITITEQATGHALLTITDLAADALYMPRGATHNNTGGAGADPALDRIPLDGQIKIVVAQGGDTKTGTLTFYVE